MATPAEVQAAIDKADASYLELNETDILSVMDGCCGGSSNNPTRCLYYLKKALKYRQDVSLYDDTTDSLVNKINRLA